MLEHGIHVCDVELWGFIVPWESDGPDPGGMDEERGGTTTTVATCTQLFVNLTCSLAFCLNISLRIWLCESGAAVLASS
jgi:hypothetical protein